MLCPGCSNTLADGARFCPRCGQSIGPSATGHVAADHQRLPSKAPIPVAGWIFISSLALAPLLIGAGWYLGLSPLLWTGVAVFGVIALVLVLGDFF